MQLFNKPLEKWELKDFEAILNDPDYKESDYVDYKKDFSFLRVDGKRKLEKKNDFRNDICAFANSEGGYLVYGIGEKDRIPNEILGVEINMKLEIFEQGRREEISKISPVAPSTIFAFIKVEENKYIVVIEVIKGFHVPYVNINDDTYRFLKRDSNQNRDMSYKEVQTMYNNSSILSEEILEFREKRIQFLFKNSILLEGERFATFHVIPESFIDSSTFRFPYILQTQKEVNCEEFFARHCPGEPNPDLDGMHYKDSYDLKRFEIFNNNIIEKIIKINSSHNQELNKPQIWPNTINDLINELTYDSINYYKNINLHSKIYLCISIFNCKGMISQYDIQIFKDYIGIVDRDKIMLEPIETYDINVEENISDAIKRLKISLCLALGIKNLKGLIN